MSLLREIQASLMQQGQQIGPILLKLRFLASRLGSDLLEEWVKHESEGYPKNVEIPEYRKIPVTYSGTFFGSFLLRRSLNRLFTATSLQSRALGLLPSFTSRSAWVTLRLS